MFKRVLCCLLLVGLLGACSSSSDSSSPGVPDLNGVWIAGPNWADWPGTNCTGLQIGFCLATRVTINQSGTALSGTVECIATGEVTQFTGRLTSNINGSLLGTGCIGADCWERTVNIEILSDGAIRWTPIDAVVVSGPATGDTCDYSGSGIAYPVATTVPSVAGLWEYDYQEGTGPCATCGDSWLNFLYITQNEDALLLVLNDAENGLMIYQGAIDASGAATYSVSLVELPPCGGFSDSGSITFSGSNFDATGQGGCPGCMCDYTAAGTKR